MKTHTYTELREVMREHGIHGYDEAEDEFYISPTRRYILGPFIEQLTAHLRGKRILDWFPEGGDCGKFGLWLWNFASEANAQNGIHAGVTVGRLKYIRDDGEGHCVGFAAHIPSRKITFIDRKRLNGETIICEVKLSKSERQSCLSWFV